MKLLVHLTLAGSAVLALVALGPAAPLPKGNPGTLYDTFDGKFALDWNVVRPDADHVSFKKVPGALVITTQRGSIHGKSQEDKVSEGTLARNIHLIDIPFKDGDWSATTCVSGIVPETTYHQAGLIVYDDDDNYLKWTYEYNWRKPGGQTFHLVAETNGVPVHDQPEANESGLKKFWLRISKRGDNYVYAWSADGERWTTAGERAWDGKGKRVGLIAKNGGNKDAAELDAAFEFFELRSLAAGKK
jgi:regulation of enolase protein 1 (concanavalin A-like superfamily)